MYGWIDKLIMAKPTYVTQPYMPPLDEFIPYLEKIWGNKILTNGGEFHQALEKELCKYLGVKFISLFSNGTVALLTALKALNIKGEVITTPFSFVATAHSLVWNDIKPVFVDISEKTLNIDPTKIEPWITEHTQAILPVHVYGNPCDVNEIKAIGEKHNLKIIYDAAHSFGVDFQGQSLLNYGDLSVLSFHATKIFNTFEGGAVICSSAEMKAHIDNLKNFGFRNEITVTETGINGKMNEVNAAFGLLQLRHMNSATDKRAKIARLYGQGLRGIEGITVKCGIESDHLSPNNSYFPILVDDKFRTSRDGLYQELKNRNIFSRRYFYPLISTFDMYRNLPSASPENLPVATKIAEQILCLPIYPDLGDDAVNNVIEIIRGK